MLPRSDEFRPHLNGGRRTLVGWLAGPGVALRRLVVTVRYGRLVDTIEISCTSSENTFASDRSRRDPAASGAACGTRGNS